MIKNLTCFKGKAKEFIFKIRNNLGEIVNLTALTGYFNVYLDLPDVVNTSILTKTLTITSATEGTCKVNLLDTDVDIDSKQYKYNVYFTYGAGDNRVLVEGDFIITGDDVDNRIKQIKQTYGFTFNNYILQNALEYARVEINNNGFENVVNDLTTKSSTIKVCHNIIDTNFDGLINEDDISICQYMNKEPYTVEDLTSHIIEINLNNPKQALIRLDSEYPEQDYILRVKYKLGSKNNSDLSVYIKKLEEWYVIKYLFENLEPNKLQNGMTSKDLNGINITFDQNAITEFNKKVNNQISYYIMKTKPFSKCQYNNSGAGGLIRSVLIPKSYN